MQTFHKLPIFLTSLTINKIIIISSPISKALQQIFHICLYKQFQLGYFQCNLFYSQLSFCNIKQKKVHKKGKYEQKLNPKFCSFILCVKQTFLNRLIYKILSITPILSMYTKKTLPEWEKMAKAKKKLLVLYQNDVLDLTMFAKSHAGGKKIIEDFFLKDVSSKIFKLYPHDPYHTLNTLMRYKCGILISPRRSTSHSEKQSQDNSQKCGNHEEKEANTKLQIIPITEKPKPELSKFYMENPANTSEIPRENIKTMNSSQFHEQIQEEEEEHMRFVPKFLAKFMSKINSQ